MKRKDLLSTPETGAFGIQTVYRNAGPWVKARLFEARFLRHLWRLALASRKFAGSVQVLLTTQLKSRWKALGVAPPLPHLEEVNWRKLK
jgi:hypothetical protein